MKIELCAASIEALTIAKELTIDRVELCQNLEQGGITPSIGFIEYSIALGLETHVLIRPRPGGFRYSEEEIEIMVRDIQECRAIGAHGVVVGVLDENNKINIAAMELFMKVADDLEVTFHRAFDDTDRFRESIDILVDLGVKRILSSGLEGNVDGGTTNLIGMVEHANRRIEIMPGGGVNLNNIKSLLELVKPSAIHFSGTEKRIIDEYSMFSEAIFVPCKSKIEDMLAAVK